tara:strand:- start:855 stop:1778 length:924 start_codon:yes stop_codon:yes gene_type:complete
LKILISGHGAHAKKRIIPALIKFKEIESIDIVLRDSPKNKDLNIKYIDLNLSENKNRLYDYVIIASPPYAHMKNLEDLINNSNNFIIEKPIFNKPENLTEDIFNTKYREKNIYESLMYLYHPIWLEVKKIFKEEKILQFSSSFTIPSLEATNYRYRKEKGGGFTLDLGIYPISLFYNLIEEDFNIKNSKIHYHENHEVDIGGSLEIEYGDSISYKANWGLSEKYRNYLEIKTTKSVYNFPFIFTKSEDFESYFIKTTDGEEEKINIGNFDQFYMMYENIFQQNTNNIKNNIPAKKTYNLLFDLLIES